MAVIVAAKLECHLAVIEDMAQGLLFPTQPTAVIQPSPQCQIAVVWQCICGSIESELHLL